MGKRLGTVYHLVDTANLASIQAKGLMSTAKLVAQTRWSITEQKQFLREYRATGTTLDTGVVIRDHRPMPPAALARALPPGMAPEDWYQRLNELVFFWTDLERLERQRKACAPRLQTILAFDGDQLADSFREHAFVSPINSGNARRKPASRDADTLMPYAQWLMRGWPRGQRWRRPVELLFDVTIPVRAPYLQGQ